MPWKRGHRRSAPLPDYEDYVFDQWEHGVFDGLLEADGHLCAQGSTTSSCRRGHGAHVGLVRPLSPHGDGQLHRPVRSKKRAGAADPGALDPRRPLDRPTPATSISAPARRWTPLGRADYLALRLRWFDRWLKGMPAAWRPSRRCGSSSWAAAPGGETPRAGSITAAAGAAERDWPIPDAEADRLLSAWRRAACRPRPPAAQAPPMTYDFDPEHPVPTIGGTITSGEPVMRRRRFRPARGAAVLRLARALSAAGRAARRPGLPDRSRWSDDVEVTGADRSAAVDRLRRPGHRFHASS